MPDDSLSISGEEAAKKLISLAEAAKLSGLSQGHLRLLANQEKIWAVKIGRNWVTTEKAVQAYLSTNPRPGPKSKE
ncbi:MAG: helix-turn-helix domain-containing protein [Ardenticatenaceae bacterium]|nr:helix-turn-helix domain-containing protein [Ardenticatenaceae bacterium]